MLDVEVFGAELALGAPSPREVRRLCLLATAAVGVEDGHLAIEYVDEPRIAQLNAEHRGKAGPTDVLSFPIDGVVSREGDLPSEGAASQADAVSRDSAGGPFPTPDTDPFDTERLGDSSHLDSVERELGDVVICPAHTSDLREAIVHGVLHLVGFDHEIDDGEMLALQARLLARESP